MSDGERNSFFDPERVQSDEAWQVRFDRLPHEMTYRPMDGRPLEVGSTILVTGGWNGDQTLRVTEVGEPDEQGVIRVTAMPDEAEPILWRYALRDDEATP